ncbi:MAG: RUS1 family protein, partial [Armatimonadetes bacterium]|nr:RUS1 family protein [Armatimonadota bacterium]
MIAIDYGRLYASAPAAKAAPQPPAAPAPPPSPQPDPLQDPKAVAVEVHDRSATVYTPNGKGGLQASGPPAAEGSGKFSGFLRKTFLPSNYPSQVHSDYVPFRKWASVANFAQSGLEFFATQGILAGLGLSASAPTVATIAFFAKDALNFVGQIVGGAVARKADIEPVKWYARAQTISAVSRVAQTALIVAPGAFWVLAPASNAANAFASAIKGAATANIDNHQALGVNVGELKAKNGNQDLVTGAVGASLSI